MSGIWSLMLGGGHVITFLASSSHVECPKAQFFNGKKWGVIFPQATAANSSLAAHCCSTELHYLECPSCTHTCSCTDADACCLKWSQKVAGWWGAGPGRVRWSLAHPTPLAPRANNLVTQSIFALLLYTAAFDFEVRRESLRERGRREIWGIRILVEQSCFCIHVKNNSVRGAECQYTTCSWSWSCIRSFHCTEIYLHVKSGLHPSTEPITLWRQME